MSCNNVRKTASIHQLVARAFIPNPENKTTVNHKDGNKSNNNVENLEWNTNLENFKHAVENKLKPSWSGESNAKAKLNEAKVREIRHLFEKGKTRAEIRDIYKIGWTTASDIIARRTWRHVD
jgi:hypothetical protein